jgi:hypothetical protein
MGRFAEPVFQRSDELGANVRRVVATRGDTFREEEDQ